MNRHHLYLLAAVLTLVASGIVVYKAIVLQFPLHPVTEADAWDVEIRVSFQAMHAPAKVSLYLPREDGPFAAADEQFISRGYGVNTRHEEGNRRVVWSIRRARGEQFLFYRATIRPVASLRETREKWPQIKTPEIVDDARKLAIDAVLADVRAHSADSETFVSEVIKRVSSVSPDGNVKSLLGRNTAMEDRIEVMSQVLAGANIPVRAVHGLRLQTYERDAQFIVWMEAWYENSWHSFDPLTGEPRLDPDLVTWWHGPSGLVEVTGGRNSEANVTVRLNREPAMQGALWRERELRPALFEFSVLGLPIETQAVYQILLAMPVGVFLLVVLRNVVGVKTFGTFMPVLIALAFRETNLLLGLLLFTLVVGMGLAIRFYLERLKLLLVPRLAAVLIVVLMLITLISIFSNQLGVYRGLSVALFPIVILTMTIERMSIVWEERGATEALQQGLGSLVVAACAYIVMNLNSVQYFVFVFPELLLILLAATLLLGRYTGFRLTELVRFRALSGGGK